MQIAFGLFMISVGSAFAMALFLGFWLGTFHGYKMGSQILDSMGCAEEMLAELHPVDDCTVLKCKVCNRVSQWQSVMEAE